MCYRIGNHPLSLATFRSQRPPRTHISHRLAPSFLNHPRRFQSRIRIHQADTLPCPTPQPNPRWHLRPIVKATRVQRNGSIARRIDHRYGILAVENRRSRIDLDPRNQGPPELPIPCRSRAFYPAWTRLNRSAVRYHRQGNFESR